MRSRSKVYYGWWIVLAASGLSAYMGGTFTYTFTVFFDPIKESLQTTTTAMTFAFMLQRLEGGIAAPISGFLFDRIGPRKLMMAGTVISASGFALMSTVESLTPFYVSYALVSVGFSFGVGGVVRATIANWFIRLRGRAMAGQLAGFGLSGFMAPVMVASIATFGWRTSLMAVAIGLLIIGISVSRVMIQRPEKVGLLPDGDSPEAQVEGKPLPIYKHGGEENFTVRQAISSGSFWAMTIGFMLGDFGMSALMVFETPALGSVGFSREVAALVITGITATSIIGRIGFGWLIDLHSKRGVAAIAMAMQSAGVLLFGLLSTERTWLLPLFLVCYAPGYGGTVVIKPAMQGAYFGRTYFGTIQGLSMTISAFAGMAGPVIAGRIYDTLGSYVLAFIVFAGLNSVGMLIVLLFAKRPVLHKRELVAVSAPIA